MSYTPSDYVYNMDVHSIQRTAWQSPHRVCVQHVCAVNTEEGMVDTPTEYYVLCTTCMFTQYRGRHGSHPTEYVYSMSVHALHTEEGMVDTPTEYVYNMYVHLIRRKAWQPYPQTMEIVYYLHAQTMCTTCL